MAAMADDGTAEAAAALANRVAKRQRWIQAIHESSKYKAVHAVIMAGNAVSVPLPEELPKTPCHEDARSKRHWEGLCRKYRHCLQRLYDFINGNPEMRMIVEKSTNQSESESSLRNCFQS